MNPISLPTLLANDDLHLPPATMSWTLIGPAADHRLSQERQDILTLLQEHRDGPLTPKSIATLLHKDTRAVTKLLFDMSHANQISVLGRGQYMLFSNIGNIVMNDISNDM